MSVDANERFCVSQTMALTLSKSRDYDAPQPNVVMKLYDISVRLSAATPVYPGDPKVEIKPWLHLDKGDATNVSLLSLSAHSGTHVDAPSHFFAGSRKVETLSLATLIGEAHVVELPLDRLSIDLDFVDKNFPQGCRRLIFKTRNSEFWNNSAGGIRTDYSYLEPEAAERLVAMGIQLVGIDYLSIDKFDSKFAAHRALLANDVIILEGLDLSHVPAGRYELICLPLRIAEGTGDGAPARAILRTL
ncbi:MAG TPA: cyclase family protein [Pyrinomonadaceae bacterium]|nr:cyclase family protein [Pyrinomonadaceae bacterium]